MKMIKSRLHFIEQPKENSDTASSNITKPANHAIEIRKQETFVFTTPESTFSKPTSEEAQDIKGKYECNPRGPESRTDLSY